MPQLRVRFKKLKAILVFFPAQGVLGTEGIYFDNRVCFPEIRCTKRTHSDFFNRINDDYHITNSTTIITEIPHLDIIDNFPLDYMHRICLGIMKKLILLWLGITKKALLSIR